MRKAAFSVAFLMALPAWADVVRCDTPGVKRTLVEILLPRQLQEIAKEFSVVDITTISRPTKEKNIWSCQGFVFLPPGPATSSPIRIAVRYSVLVVDSDPTKGSVSVTQQQAARFMDEFTVKYAEDQYKQEQAKFGCKTPNECLMREQQSQGYSMAKFPIQCDFDEIKTAIVRWVEPRYGKISSDQITLRQATALDPMNIEYTDKSSPMFDKGVTCEAEVAFAPGTVVARDRSRDPPRQLGQPLPTLRGLKIAQINVDWVDPKARKMNIDIARVSEQR